VLSLFLISSTHSQLHWSWGYQSKN